MLNPPRILGAFVLFAATYLADASQNLFVASPNLLRVNSDEDVWVTLHDTPGTVKLYLENYPDRGHKFSQRSVSVGRDESKKVTMRVGWGDIPQGSQQTYVYLVAECQALGFKKESVILLSKTSGYLFLQTDKPIYNPHETGIPAAIGAGPGRVFIPPLKHRNEEQVSPAIVIAEIGLPISGYPNDDIEEVNTSMTIYESDYLEPCSAAPTPPKCVKPLTMRTSTKTKKNVVATNMTKSKSSRPKVGTVRSASGSKVTSQDIRDLQLKVLQATLEAQVAVAETQKVQQEEANAHIELMKVKMEYLREKMEEEALRKFVDF